MFWKQPGSCREKLSFNQLLAADAQKTQLFGTARLALARTQPLSMVFEATGMVPRKTQL